MTVLVDTHIVNTCGYGMMVFKACEELGVACQTLELPSPFTIMWKRTLTECSRVNELQVEEFYLSILFICFLFCTLYTNKFMF